MSVSPWFVVAIAAATLAFAWGTSNAVLYEARPGGAWRALGALVAGLVGYALFLALVLVIASGCRDATGPFYRTVTLCETVAEPGAPLECRVVRCEVRDGRIVRETCV